MATEATFTVPSDQFPLGTVFEQLPSVGVELERLIPARDVVIPYFWVRGTDVDDIEADYYVLAHIQPPNDSNRDDGWSVELLGIASKDRLLEAHRVKSDLGFYNRSLWLEDLDPIPLPSYFEPV